VQSIREQAIPQVPMPDMKEAPAPEAVQ
jgi:hypothetical protein